jgi:hypothetical protein
VTPSVSSKGITDATDAGKGLAESSPTVCTPVCTSNAGNAKTDTVATLAAALVSLSPGDRARLAALLTGQAEGEGGTP